MSQSGRPPSKRSPSSKPSRSSRGPSSFRGPGNRPSGGPTGPTKVRRAFSGATSGGDITHGGAKSLADGLAAALSQARRDIDIALSVTHPLHTYPARMHPGTARVLVDLVAGGTGRTPRVLDPFCGSGTTLVEARYRGAEAIGIDINPLAVMIARAKTWTSERPRRQALETAGAAISATSLAEVRAARRSGYEGSGFRVPAGANRIERDKALRDWFSPHVRRELEFLAGAIDKLYREDEQLGDILRVVLSSILYKVSKRASDTDPSKVERAVARGAATRLFGDRVKLLLAGLDELYMSSRAPVPAIHLADARELTTIVEPGSIDAIITSPPYMGTYDYRAQHELRLMFLGLPLDDFDSREMGARRHFTTSEGGGGERARVAWQKSLSLVFRGVSRVLRPGGQAVIMIGDSVAAGRAVRADADVKELAIPEGLDVLAWASQTRPLVTASERHVFSAKPKCEHLLLLQHSKRA